MGCGRALNLTVCGGVFDSGQEHSPEFLRRDDKLPPVVHPAALLPRQAEADVVRQPIGLRNNEAHLNLRAQLVHVLTPRP